MRLIGVTLDPAVIRAILTHLVLWSAPAWAGPHAAVTMNRIDAVTREALDDTDDDDPPWPLE